VVDAMRSGKPGGTIRRIDATRCRLAPHGGTVSSHGGGLALAVELARGLGRLPDRTVVFGIEVAQARGDAPLSPAVERAAARVAELVAQELAVASPPSVGPGR